MFFMVANLGSPHSSFQTVFAKYRDHGDVQQCSLDPCASWPFARPTPGQESQSRAYCEMQLDAGQKHMEKKASDRTIRERRLH